MSDKEKPTVEQSKSLQRIYDYFNNVLLDGECNNAMLVLSRNKNVVGGYFSPNKWKNEEGESIHEVGINANVVAEGDLVNTYVILLHEMIHHWQQDHGEPSRIGYHNQEWGQKMVDIGIQPICYDTGQPEEKLSGQMMSNKLITGGLAQKAIAAMSEDLPWYADEQILIDDDGQPMPMPQEVTGDGDGGMPIPPQTPQKPRRGGSGTRTKYTCTVCGLNAWAKHGASLVCGDCNRNMIAQV